MMTDRIPPALRADERAPDATPDAASRVLPPAEWQHLWFALERAAWSSLVLVPAQPDASTMPAARTILGAGDAFNRFPLRLVDAEVTDPRSAAALAQTLRDPEPGVRRIVVVGSPLTKPAVIPIIRSGDAAVLVLELGRTSLRAARRTLQVAGRERFIGAVTIRPGR
ncbi:MAG: hypothetical protein ACJ8AO_05090 [Gemmatimonadaceae bacterium]